jgi:hypothetical protein
VPQFPPESMLILGYGDGTVAGLTRRLYGDDFRIVGVDIEEPKYQYNAKFVLEDARDYLKRCDCFQVISVDLFVHYDICEFVFKEEFADLVISKCDYLVIHADYNSDMRYYEHLKKIRTLELTTHRFHYFLINRIKDFPFND